MFSVLCVLTQLSNVGESFYVQLVNISYLPILHSLTLNFTSIDCLTPITVPAVNQTFPTTSIPTLRTTSVRTTIFIPFISSITSSTTVRTSLLLAIAIIILFILLLLFLLRQRKEEEKRRRR